MRAHRFTEEHPLRPLKYHRTRLRVPESCRRVPDRRGDTRSVAVQVRPAEGGRAAELRRAPAKNSTDRITHVRVCWTTAPYHIQNKTTGWKPGWHK